MSRLSADALLAYLASDAPAEAEPFALAGPELDVDPGPYREAAAVLAAIEHPERLRPAGGGEPADVTRLLAAELVPATGRRFHGSTMLAPESRRETIADLVRRGAVQAAIAANPEERGGLVQAHLEAYLLGTAPPVEAQTLDQLDATRQVAAWLRDLVPGLPAIDVIEARGAYLRLLAPFEALAGDDVFEGRREELDELRGYVGVIPPGDLLKRVRDRAFRWLSGPARPALSIHGPGGVGKSALVARFMLEHTRVPEAARIPFAYLDFDRVTLDVGDVYGLAAEMLRQLVAQFPQGAFGSLRALMAERGDRLPPDHPERMTQTESILADVLGLMGTTLGERPYLVVLDTFEEVQFRGEARAFPLWAMLDRLQRRWPFLRVVVAGRAPVTSLRLDGNEPRLMPLGDLDQRAAVAYLRRQGVSSPDLAKRIVRTYGGVPLSLKLVASLLARDPDALDGAPRVGRGRGAVAAELIQGQLYERVLDHIRDDRVRRLAHPGLVLRRITPEVIQAVLDVPCELGVRTIDEARTLFEELGREVSLMTLDETDGALVHRSDVRRVMLRLLLASDPARVEQIRRRAVAYYDALAGRRGIAEATYHRLFLGEPVDALAVADAEVRSSIQASMVEFPAAAQVRLARLGFQVDAAVLAEADRADREQSLAALVETYLPNGPTAEDEARRVLDGVTPDLDHASPLFRAAARVAIQGGDDVAGAGWIERGLEEAGVGNEPRLAFDLVRELAWLEHRRDGASSNATLGALAEAASRHAHAPGLLLHRLLAFAARRGDPGELDLVAGMLARASSLDAWYLAPAFVAPLGVALEARHQGFLEALRALVLDPSGPFRETVFTDPTTQRALDAALDTTAGADAIGWTLARVLDTWPYRILEVAPPYGRRGPELHESAS